MQRHNRFAVIDGDETRRNRVVGALREAGHVEPYAGLAEFRAHPPYEGRGTIVVHDDGVQVVREVIALRPEMMCVAYARYPDPARVVAAVAAGADGYANCVDDPEVLRRLVLDQVRFYSDRAVRRVQAIVAGERIAKLSRRERQVLDNMALGNSNKEIARELAISPRTVEIHRANMMGKIGAGHSAQAIRMAIEAERAPPPADRSVQAGSANDRSDVAALAPQHPHQRIGQRGEDRQSDIVGLEAGLDREVGHARRRDDAAVDRAREHQADPAPRQFEGRAFEGG